MFMFVQFSSTLTSLSLLISACMWMEISSIHDLFPYNQMMEPAFIVIVRRIVTSTARQLWRNGKEQSFHTWKLTIEQKNYIFMTHCHNQRKNWNVCTKIMDCNGLSYEHGLLNANWRWHEVLQLDDASNTSCDTITCMKTNGVLDHWLNYSNSRRFPQ